MTAIRSLKRRFSTSTITADTDVFTEDFESQSNNRSGVRITLSIDTTAIAYLTETVDGTEERYALNSGSALDANDLYSFDIPIRGDGSYNIQFGSDAAVKVINIDEIEGGII